MCSQTWTPLPPPSPANFKVRGWVQICPSRLLSAGSLRLDMCSYLILCWFSEWLMVTGMWFPFFIIDSSLFLIILLTKFKIHEINRMHWEYKQLIPNYGSFKWLENTVKWGKICSSRHLPNIQNEILEKLKCVFQRIAWQFVSFHLVVPFYNIPAFHIYNEVTLQFFQKFQNLQLYDYFNFYSTIVLPIPIHKV